MLRSWFESNCNHHWFVCPWQPAFCFLTLEALCALEACMQVGLARLPSRGVPLLSSLHQFIASFHCLCTHFCVHFVIIQQKQPSMEWHWCWFQFFWLSQHSKKVKVAMGRFNSRLCIRNSTMKEMRFNIAKIDTKRSCQLKTFMRFMIAFEAQLPAWVCWHCNANPVWDLWWLQRTNGIIQQSCKWIWEGNHLMPPHWDPGCARKMPHCFTASDIHLVDLFNPAQAGCGVIVNLRVTKGAKLGHCQNWHSKISHWKLEACEVKKLDWLLNFFC